MEIEMNSYQLRLMLENAAELGVIFCLIQCGRIKPYMKKSEAFRKYGRRTVEIWIMERLITPRKDGNYSANWRIDRIELETVAKSVELLRYLSHIYGTPHNK